MKIPTIKVASLVCIFIFASFTLVSAETASNTSEVKIFTEKLQLGDKGEQVIKLQEFLAKDSTIYPEGLVTGYFGSLTKSALIKFQSSQDLQTVGFLNSETTDRLNALAQNAILDTVDKSPLTALGSSTPSTISEIDLIRSCLYQSNASSTCSKTDLNKDGVTNIEDAAILKALIRFDLSGDNKIDIRTRDSADVAAVTACFYKAAEGNCGKADFSGDGKINFADLSLLKANSKYDLNADSVIDLNIKSVAVVYLSDLDLIKNCMFQSAKGDCVIADISKDGIVNFQDVSIIKTAEVYDLDGDKKVDLRDSVSKDLPIIKSCIYKVATGDCAKADLTKDGIINFADLSLLKAQSIFDTNKDSVIDLRTGVNSL